MYCPHKQKDGLKVKITISKNLLLEGLGVVAKAVSTRATMPILECVLLTVTSEGLKLTANDLEFAIETKFIESEVIEEGAVALDVKVFNDIARAMPSTHIEIDCDEKNLTVIKSGKTEFKILGMTAADFPELPQVQKNQSYKIISNEFKNMIKQTVFSVSNDLSKPVLCGQLIDVKADDITIVAVDGFRISLRKSVLQNSAGDVKIVVPGKAMNEISRILPTDNDATTEFYTTEKHVLFELENCTVVSRLLEGEFINYENMFGNDTTTLITANRIEMIDSIDRATLISKDSKKSPVKLKVEDSVINISSNTEMGTSNEEINVMQDGPDLEIAFNPKYLIEAMKAMEAEKITMSLTSSLSPCVIKTEGSEDYKYLVLPLRLRG